VIEFDVGKGALSV